ncbi:solute carrier family 41 member 3-like [Diorhabda carinulata]|uniref:solute carrier family 41 member 3-like n=1 Tax=Diorhabda carinulata TaxID=1163345 RepID=UPI0025A04DCB|nr:solute carrier family 41 member 3-like [Diorhabda carinulata]XP_057669414.1 solute carrier family 41 member 3-like [Diorhabda carinulata]
MVFDNNEKNKNDFRVSVQNGKPEINASNNDTRNNSLLSKKNSVREMYTIYGGLPITKENARLSILSIQSEKQKLVEERWYQIFIQVSIPFFIAGLGTIGAGIVLNRVQEHEVFKNIDALFVLVPALLGLKGNLDMCLASRLSTQTNLGNMNERKKIISIVTGNVLLVQIQAIVASCLVSVFAVSVSAIFNKEFNWIHTLLLATSSTLTATMSCFILDIVLVSLIIASRKFKLNPDNIATPMAASIGDVVSLIMLSTWASFLYSISDDFPWVMGLIMGLYLLVFLPTWIFIVRKNDYTKAILTNGWVPVISALFISGSGGLILDLAVNRFYGYTMFQPIINGLGGNLVSVQASRISTMLHKTSFEGVIPSHTKQWVNPYTALIYGVLPAKSARLLLILSIPGYVVFLFLADIINNKGTLYINAIFSLTYVCVGFTQIVTLLYICHLLVHTMWKFRKDPDNSSIPYLTALGDLLGSSLLLLGFFFVESIDSEYGS